MTEEQIFKNRFPEYCVGERCISPYFDLFQIGFEEGENQNKKLQEENARLKKESKENQDLATIAYMHGATDKNPNYEYAMKYKEIVERLLRLFEKTVNPVGLEQLKMSLDAMDKFRKENLMM